MYHIRLSPGNYALIDNCDFETVKHYNWRLIKKPNTNYASARINDKIVLMHRLILKPAEGMQVDHINRNGLDNRRENIRVVTCRQNHWNMVTQAKHIGVWKHRNKYKAAIRVGNKDIYLGLYKTPEDASKAYMDYAMKIEKQVICDVCKITPEQVEQNLNLFT